jgi:hypothetical protein
MAKKKKAAGKKAPARKATKKLVAVKTAKKMPATKSKKTAKSKKAAKKKPAAKSPPKSAKKTPASKPAAVRSTAARSGPAAEYLAKLTAIGWFHGLPDAAVRDIEKNVAEACRKGETPQPWPKQGWFDAECIYDQGDYTELFSTWTGASYGVFEPTDVSEVWDDDPEGEAIAWCTFGFTLGKSRFQSRFEIDSDYYCEEFVELIEKAMKQEGKGLMFADIETGGQDGLVALCNAEAYRKAIKLKLVRDPSDSDGEDW